MTEESSWKIEHSRYYPKLTKNIDADVVIIGAGITGILSAYILAESGLKVVVLEENKKILQNGTMYTTAFITKIIDTPFRELCTLFGKEKAELIWQSGEKAISVIADIIKREDIDCEFQFVPIYTYAKDEKEHLELSLEYGAISKSGFESSFHSNDATGSGQKGLGFPNSGFIKIEHQAKFHPIKFAEALARKATEKGVEIFTDSRVVSMEHSDVRTAEHRIHAKDILIATYSPLTNEGTHFKKAMYVSYVYELEIKKGLLGEGLYLDMNNPYHYFRIDAYENFDRMIVGGEDHREDIQIDREKNFRALLEYVDTVLEKGAYKIKRQWEGQILEPVGGLPFIGTIEPHIQVATAFGGNGMTYAAISAQIARDVITGRENPYIELYSPQRHMTIKQIAEKAVDFTGEFFGGALKNWLNF